MSHSRSARSHSENPMMIRCANCKSNRGNKTSHESTYSNSRNKRNISRSICNRMTQSGL